MWRAVLRDVLRRLCAFYLADDGLHDGVKARLGGVQVTGNPLPVDLLLEVRSVSSEAEDVPVAEGGLAVKASVGTGIDDLPWDLTHVGQRHLVHKGPET